MNKGAERAPVGGERCGQHMPPPQLTPKLSHKGSRVLGQEKGGKESPLTEDRA